ncbi:hypothetical protein JTF08_08675 [Micrococcaceae bacterium RIT802]|nr:hypothetical protein [Micrococcaceae bacterium RIT 802]
MSRRPRASAPLLVGGLLAALVIGPLAILAGLVLAASSMAATYYGLLDGPGPGTVLLLALGGVLMLAGWIAVIVGVHRLAGTIDALGRHAEYGILDGASASAPPPRKAAE